MTDEKGPRFHPRGGSMTGPANEVLEAFRHLVTDPTMDPREKTLIRRAGFPLWLGLIHTLFGLAFLCWLLQLVACVALFLAWPLFGLVGLGAYYAAWAVPTRRGGKELPPPLAYLWLKKRKLQVIWASVGPFLFVTSFLGSWAEREVIVLVITFFLGVAAFACIVEALRQFSQRMAIEPRCTFHRLWKEHPRHRAVMDRLLPAVGASCQGPVTVSVELPPPTLRPKRGHWFSDGGEVVRRHWPWLRIEGTVDGTSVSVEARHVERLLALPFADAKEMDGVYLEEFQVERAGRVVDRIRTSGTTGRASREEVGRSDDLPTFETPPSEESWADVLPAMKSALTGEADAPDPPDPDIEVGPASAFRAFRETLENELEAATEEADRIRATFRLAMARFQHALYRGGEAENRELQACRDLLDACIETHETVPVEVHRLRFVCSRTEIGPNDIQEDIDSDSLQANDRAFAWREVGEFHRLHRRYATAEAAYRKALDIQESVGIETAENHVRRDVVARLLQVVTLGGGAERLESVLLEVYEDDPPEIVGRAAVTYGRLLYEGGDFSAAEHLIGAGIGTRDEYAPLLIAEARAHREGHLILAEIAAARRDVTRATRNLVLAALDSSWQIWKAALPAPLRSLGAWRTVLAIVTLMTFYAHLPAEPQPFDLKSWDSISLLAAGMIISGLAGNLFGWRWAGLFLAVDLAHALHLGDEWAAQAKVAVLGDPGLHGWGAILLHSLLGYLLGALCGMADLLGTLSFLGKGQTRRLRTEDYPFGTWLGQVVLEIRRRTGAPTPTEET